MARSLITVVLTIAAVVLTAIPSGAHSAEPSRPNILWIMAEDIGCDLTCYGAPAVRTPNLDRMAAEGLLLSRAYTTAPICSSSRSAMMTAMHQTSIDAHHHRSHRDDGYTLPEPIRPITAYLREAGYYCVAGCGYGAKTDLNYRVREEDRPLFDGEDWAERAPDQPFFAQVTLHVTHRGNWWRKTRRESADPVDPATVVLPPYLPDLPEIRRDWALYLDQMERADQEVADLLKRLDDEGIADDTVVIFIGDNGRCVHRGKGFLYEDGIHVPCIIRWPRQIEAGDVSDGLVSMIDVSAQILAWAGVEVPAHLEGRPFLSGGAEPRDYVFAARDRWDEVYDKSRAVVGRRFKYLRNDMPQTPVFTHQAYLERVRPIRPILLRAFEAGEMTPAQAAVMALEKPAEELYDLENDPWETTNLAGRPDHAETLAAMRRALETWEEETGDRGQTEEPRSAVGERVWSQIFERRELIRSGERR